jgi:hypothetical protein
MCGFKSESRREIILQEATDRRVCTPPPLVRGEDTLAGWRGGWGVNILEDARHSSVLYICKYFVQRAVKASKCATNSATHLPIMSISPWVKPTTNTYLSKSLEARSCSSLAAVLTPRLGLINRYSRFTFVVRSSFSTRTFIKHGGLAER